MGQYHIIVNLSKRAFLHPDAFNDGCKLREFGESRGGTILALVGYLAADNQGGVAEFHLPYDLKKHRTPTRHKNADGKWHKGPPPDWVPPDPCPEPIKSLVGSWAGDRIVIAGDYGKPGQFLTKRQFADAKELSSEAGHDRAICEHKPYEEYMNPTPNLHFYAQRRFYDASHEMLHAMELCRIDTTSELIDDPRVIVYSILERCLISEFGAAREHDDFTWLNPDTLETLIFQCTTAAALRTVKSWLLKQKLSVIVRELVPTYFWSSSKHRRGVQRQDHLRTPILTHHGVDLRGFHRHRWPSLLNLQRVKPVTEKKRSRRIELKESK